MDTLEVTFRQVLGPSKARKMHDYSSSGVFIGAFPTCKIKQSRRAHFDLCDSDWVYIQKRRVQGQKRSKLHPRGDGPFHVLESIESKGYNLDQDSRTNPLEERGSDVISRSFIYVQFLNFGNLDILGLYFSILLDF